MERMTTEITNEVRAKIFGLYLGSPFRYLGSSGTVRKVEGITFSWSVIDSNSEQFRVSKCQLILKPLSEISDEDAIECAKWFSMHPQLAEDYEDIIAGFALDKITRRDNSIKVAHSLGCFEGEFILYFDGAVEITEEEGEKRTGYCLNSETTDYLRSKSYALPYLGIDLFESKIAIKP